MTEQSETGAGWRARWFGRVYEAWFGLDGYVTHPRSGRPQPNQSWTNSMIRNWFGWALATMFGFAAFFFYYSWGEIDPALAFAAVAVIAVIVTFPQHWELRRRKRELNVAIRRYETGLSKAFSEIDNAEEALTPRV